MGSQGLAVNGLGFLLQISFNLIDYWMSQETWRHLGTKGKEPRTQPTKM